MRELHTGLRFYSILPLFCALLASAILTGCVSSGGYNTQPWQEANRSSQQTAAQTPNDLSIASVEQHNLGAPNQTQGNALPPVKVAILLPLSGQHSKLGQSMLNAAQIALFDVGYDNFELLPKDTKGTPEGAREAARNALKDGAKLVLGPVFSSSVKAARQVTQSANINMIAFSTDWTLANNRTFLIGFLPFDQVERVIRYASHAGYNRIGVLSPRNSYGNGVVSAYQSISRRVGIETSRIERFAPQGNDLGPIIKSFSDYDARRASGNAHGAPFNAILMPVGGTVARQVSSFLNHYDLPAGQVKRLGTGLMDDPALARDKTMDGTWFAAPAPAARMKFERRYNGIYHATPPRIASLAYDATALAASLARTGLQYDNRPAYNHNAITNPNGFSGVDGIFRFRSDGIVERGLAILEYRKGIIVVIDKAPKTFQKNVF
ncbi:MAG: penicillin-binding protein activator [Zetaproteobacteria bacterium]|nr:MAG: penicillin-binding protein activator [Zetaproteobacteria bacterium]